MMDVLHMQSVNEHSSLDRASSTAPAGEQCQKNDTLHLGTSFLNKFLVCVKICRVLLML